MLVLETYVISLYTDIFVLLYDTLNIKAFVKKLKNDTKYNI